MISRILLFLGLFASFSFAQTHGEYQGNCARGNKTILTAGIVSTTKTLQSYSSCTVSVYETGTLSLATLYDSSDTPLTNPFTANTDGSYQFFTDSIFVDIQLSGGGIPSPFTLGAQSIINPLATANIYNILMFGGVCNGVNSEDAGAFQNAIDFVPPGSIITTPSGCRISSQVTIDKPLTLSAGGPGNPTAQLLLGVNSINMFLVSNTNGVTFLNLGFDANGHTGAVAVALSSATTTRFDNINWSGAWTNPVTATASLFTTFLGGRVNAGSGQMSFINSSNNITFVNTTFNSAIGGLLAHNGAGLNITGGAYEGGSIITMYNWIGDCDISGLYLENQGTLLAGTAYLSLGAPFSGAPVLGCDVHGNFFNGGADWGILVGPGSGVDIHGNSFVTKSYAIVQNGGSAYADGNRDLHIGPNYYNINSAGYDESKILLNAGPSGLGSNVSQLVINPLLFSGSMPTCQSTWVPTADSCVWWSGTGLSMQSNGSTDYLINKLHSLGTSFVDGQMTVRPVGNVATASTVTVYRNTHDFYVGSGASTGGSLCSNTEAYAGIICTNDALPIDLGVGGTITTRILPGGGGVSILPTTVSGLPACTDSTIDATHAPEGARKPVTDANSLTFNAVVAGGGANHIEAYCAGTAQGWRVH